MLLLFMYEQNTGIHLHFLFVLVACTVIVHEERTRISAKPRFGQFSCVVQKGETFLSVSGAEFQCFRSKLELFQGAKRTLSI